VIKFRQISKDGGISGGPMYYIRNDLKNIALVNLFAPFDTIIRLIGTKTLVQSNSIAIAFSSFGLHYSVATIVITIIVAVVTIGVLQQIAVGSGKLCP
jgi:AGCS family alanine or glycine:cation symporter